MSQTQIKPEQPNKFLKLAKCFWPLPSNTNIQLKLLWIALTFVMAYCDYLMGPFIQFPALYILPIVFASWYSGSAWGIGVGVFGVISRVCFLNIWHSPYNEAQIFINAAIRLVVFVAIAIIIAQNAKYQKEIKVLRGVLPICSFCKKIRDESENWVQLEEYITNSSEARFSHGLCPDCLKEHYQYFPQHQKETDH